MTKAIEPNVAARLKTVATLMPSAIAIAEPDGPVQGDGKRSYRALTFQALDRRSDEIALGLSSWGVKPGMRLVMLVPFSSQFIELVFGLLKAGVAVVLIDPGMGRKHLVRCLRESKPDGFVGIPKAQAIRSVLRRQFRTAVWNVTVGRKWFWGGKTLKQLIKMGQLNSSQSPITSRQMNDPAAVIFTTGSTGPPKGVLYSHRTFHSQIDRIRERYDIHRGSKDLACFPLFGLFDAVMGVTTVIPDMDPTRPAEVNPQRLMEAVDQWEIDQAFGSPALWNRVVRWAESEQLTQPFPTLRRILSAGAPVPAQTLKALRQLVHEEAEIVTPYGATEALPIASIESREVIAETGPAAEKGKGTCVGSRFEGVQWRVIEISDEPISNLSDTTQVDAGKIGELLVTGPMVTEQYVVRSDQNPVHKVWDGERVWHRMGDVGYLDRHDRFWFCGRKAHRVVTVDRTLFTIPCEAIFNAHHQVYRSALIGIGKPGQQKPVMLIETYPESQPANDEEVAQLRAELLLLGSRNPTTRRIQEVVIRKQPLPVDIRHNSKIFREKLAEQYAEQIL